MYLKKKREREREREAAMDDSSSLRTWSMHIFFSCTLSKEATLSPQD
jgi:hypothetical protein